VLPISAESLAGQVALRAEVPTCQYLEVLSGWLPSSRTGRLELSGRELRAAAESLEQGQGRDSGLVVTLSTGARSVGSQPSLPALSTYCSQRGSLCSSLCRSEPCSERGSELVCILLLLATLCFCDTQAELSSPCKDPFFFVYLLFFL
jgi:hypothetical protein